jgi:hypothetical protein
MRAPVLLIIPSAVDPPARGAGQATRVKVERPTGRTTLTRVAWSARLARVDGGWDDQASLSHSGKGSLSDLVIIPEPEAPAGGTRSPRGTPDTGGHRC